MKVLVLGGDGFCGWPTSLHLSDIGHDVIVVDNLSRRAIDVELGVDSLTPITSMEERVKVWKEISGKTIGFVNLDLAKEYDRFAALLKSERPDAIVHFGEQRAAPYSMRNEVAKRYTVDNNVTGTHNVLVAIVESGLPLAPGRLHAALVLPRRERRQWKAPYRERYPCQILTRQGPPRMREKQQEGQREKEEELHHHCQDMRCRPDSKRSR